MEQALQRHFHDDVYERKGLIAFKDADETVTSSTTYQNDNHLSFKVVPGTWLWTTHLYCADLGALGSGHGLRIKYTLPSGTTGKWGVVSEDSGDWVAADTELFIIGHAAVFPYIQFRTTAVITTAGTAQLAWAQFNSSATPTTLKQHSHVIGKRVR